MSTAAAASPAAREPDLAGQTVVVTGGSAGIGLEAARRARAEAPASSSPAVIPRGCSKQQVSSARWTLRRRRTWPPSLFTS